MITSEKLDGARTFWDGKKPTAPMMTLHHLEPGTLFRDRDSLWRVIDEEDEEDEGAKNGKICAQRIASWNVNYTGELTYNGSTTSEDGCGALLRGYEHYNAYNEVRLVGGIYEVCAGAFRSKMFQE